MTAPSTPMQNSCDHSDCNKRGFLDPKISDGYRAALLLESGLMCTVSVPAQTDWWYLTLGVRSIALLALAHISCSYRASVLHHVGLWTRGRQADL